MENVMTNVGSLDRILRAVLGIALLALTILPVSANALSGIWIWIVPAIGAVLLLTAIFRFCPAYTVLGIHTSPIK